MSDVLPILRDPGTRHWVKCILGLDELGIAILPHIKDLFRNYYDRHFWDYHHLGCTLDCKHDHFYHLGPGPSEPCMCCLNNASTNHAHHQIENENFHESLYSNDYEHNEPTQCNLKQSVQFPEGFADWKLSKRLGYDSCYHYITCIKKDCKHDNCSCRKVFKDLVKKHKNMHGQDGCCHVKKRGKDWFLETKPECTACESAFDLLKKLFVNTEKIYWRNINFPEDFRDSWQLTKAFMPSRNTNIDDPTKADPVALLTVMNNCLLFEDVQPNLVDKIHDTMNILRSPGKRHWVKCMLGLDELGIVILPHIKAVFKEYYDEHFWEYHYLGCTLDCQHNHSTHIDCWHVFDEPGDQCWHSPEKVAEYKLSGRYCNWVYTHNDRVRNRDCHCREYFNKLVEGHKKMHGKNPWYQVQKKKNGPSVLNTRPDCNACQSAFELLKRLVVDPERTYWRNFNFPRDFGDSWRLAKAFMPSGNTDIDDPPKDDPSALLKVINNCTLFEDVDTSLIDTILEMRNSLVHMGSQKDSIDEEQTDKFFSLIIKFLGSFKELSLCQEKIATIKKIKASEVTAEMFTKANAHQIQSLLNTLNDAIADGKDISKIVADFECALKDKVEAESVDKYLEKEQKLRKLLNDTKLELAEQQHINSNQKKTICAINAMIDNLQANISKIEEENSYLKNELARKERINSDQEKMIDARNIQIDTLRTEKSKIEQENSDLEKECINLCNYLVIICIASSIILGMLLY